MRWSKRHVWGRWRALASDADFLRRVYLDLNGTIPDAATARAFLDDPAPDKRAGAGRSAVGPSAVCPAHAARVRRDADGAAAAEEHPGSEWTFRTPSGRSICARVLPDNKPLDQLVREILAADGVDPALRPAAKFYLDREGDANLLARDIGRLFFGRDMQCAQCHDHPLVDDYLQADYYGLMAFVNRGVLFDDTKDKKTYYAETADGEVNYKSVFTGDARDHVLPKLPQGGAGQRAAAGQGRALRRGAGQGRAADARSTAAARNWPP